MDKYRCTVCGYVYEPGIPFADLPDYWVCPLCGVGKGEFVPVQDSEDVKAAASKGSKPEAKEEAPVTRSYTNGEITVFWVPVKCNHNGNCTRRLPQVFDVKARPWVNIKGSDSATIAKVVEECPTGALTVAWEKK